MKRTVQHTMSARPMNRGTWILTAVLTVSPHVARADNAPPTPTPSSAPAAGAAPVCKPHADPKAALVPLGKAIELAHTFDADSLANSPTLPKETSGMLRQIAAIVECDKATTTSWPTQQGCLAISAFCAVGRARADCLKDAEKRTACLEKARTEDPRVTADRLIAQAHAEADRIDSLIAVEVACRASTKCLDKRAASVACYNLQRKRELLESIKEEKANPGGVVDLVRLHELGEGVKNAEADFKVAAADYQAKQHKAFRESLCR